MSQASGSEGSKIGSRRQSNALSNTGRNIIGGASNHTGAAQSVRSGAVQASNTGTGKSIVEAKSIA